MRKYKPLEDFVDNEQVIKCLDKARFPGEVLLAENIKSEGEEVFKVYIQKTDKSYFNLAILTKAEKQGINNWYIKLEGKWGIEVNQ